MRISRAIALALIVFVAFSCARHEAPARKLNVLLITLDTFRADRIGASTPNLSRFAASAVRFDNASSPVPLTLPAHSSLLSGVLPLHHGLRNNGAGSFPADRATLATLLHDGGYRTGAFVSAFVLDHRFGLNRGFDSYDDEITRDPAATSSFDAERRGGDTVDRALRFLAQKDARPSFTWVHLYDAHAPYAPPAPNPQTYDGEIAYVDAQVGRLLAAVDPATTVIAIVGDHGEALGEHGELTHGLLLYEPTLHVPLMIAAPGAKSRAMREPVSSVDLAPTLAALAGVPFAENAKVDGRNLASHVINGTEPARADIYAETEYPAIFGWSELAALRNGERKFIASTTPELYDLTHDPREAKNILSEERRSYRELASKLDAMRAGAQSAKPEPLDAEAKAKLASLGYVAPAALTTLSGPRPDAVSMAPLFRKFEEATWATNAGKLDAAIASFREIVARDPHNPVFRGSLARALRQQGDLAAAITLYQESVAIAPNDAEAWYNLAVTLQEAGRTKEGGIAIREAVRRDPARPEAHNALGLAFLSEGDARAAQEEFEKAIAIDPHDARAFTNLGNVLRGAGRLDEAVAQYQQALALSPRHADALNGIGVIEVQRDQPRRALEFFDRALAIAPSFYEAQLNRGIALQLAGDRAAAGEQFRRLLAQLPRGRQYDEQRAAATNLLAGLRR